MVERVACGVVGAGPVVGCGGVSAGVMGARTSGVGGVRSGVGEGGTGGDGVVRSAYGAGVGELTEWDGDVGAVM